MVMYQVIDKASKQLKVSLVFCTSEILDIILHPLGNLFPYLPYKR